MRRTLVTVLVLCLALCGLTPTWAGEVDLLINKLVEKGILSKQEATQLLNEMQKENAREKVEGEQAAAETAKKEVQGEGYKLPSWVQNTKIKGDARVRYQGEDGGSDANSFWEDRGRVRVRVYAETPLTDQWTAGFGLASGGDDPRSTNQTLDNLFSSKGIRIDEAYIGYAPTKWLSLVGGKFANPLWEPWDLLWDTDIRPEGIAANLQTKVASGLEFFLNPAFFVLDQFTDNTDDPYVVALQPGIVWKPNDAMWLRLSGTYYDFASLKGVEPTTDTSGFSSGTNTRLGGKYVFNYDSIAAGFELGFKLPFPLVPHLAFFGQYVNADTNENDSGYLAGVAFGNKKLEKFGDWQIVYNYRYLERDAWPDFLPDSDFFYGATNVKGHETIFGFGLAKHVAFGVDWYHVNTIDDTLPTPDNKGLTQQDLVQVDIQVTW